MILPVNYRLYYYNFELIRVVDGDTIRGNVDLGFNLTLSNQSIRLYGINTPEIRGEKKEIGLKVKDFVISILHNKNLIIRSFDKDNFGRLLAEVFYYDKEWISLNNYLLDLNMATVYE